MSKKIPGRIRKNTKIMTNPEIRGRDKASLNRLQQEGLISKIIRLIIEENKSKGELVEIIKKESPNSLSDNKCYSLINHAIARMEEIGRQESQVVVSIHVGWYEKIFKYFSDIDNIPGINRSLKAKEELRKIVKKNNSVTVNEKIKTTITREVGYDTSKLLPEEQKRLNELLSKAK